MEENKFHQADWDSLSDEEKAKRNELLEQHEKFLYKKWEAEQAGKLEKDKQSREEWEEDYKKHFQENFEKEQEQKAQRDKFLKTVPDNNKKVISDFLKDGHDEAWVKENHPDLLEVKKDKPKVDLQNLFEGKVTSSESQKTDSAKPKESDEAFLKRVHSKGIADSKDPDWDRFFALTQKK